MSLIYRMWVWSVLSFPSPVPGLLLAPPWKWPGTQAGKESPEAFTICQQKPKIPVGNSNGTAHSIGKFLEKMEILRGIPLFPFQPKWPEKSCTICKLPLDPVHFGLFSRHSTLQMQPSFWFVIVFSRRESLGLGKTPHRENPVPLWAFHSNRIFRSTGKRPCITCRCMLGMTPFSPPKLGKKQYLEKRFLIWAWFIPSAFTLDTWG